MKTIRYYILLFAAMIAMACSSDNDTVDNPSVMFCEVNGHVAVSQLTFTNWQGFQMVDINANTDWEVSCEVDWVTLSNRSGCPTVKENLHLKVSVEENTSGTDRSTDIILTGGGVTSRLSLTQSAQPVDNCGWPSAQEAGNAMKVGLNLYNSLDAWGTWFDWNDIDAFQTCWGNPLVTADWFRAVKSLGFNAVRIPVTWFPHMDENNHVSEAWMSRVEEVVNYALGAGLYCILNVHHDTGSDEQAWLRADWSGIDPIQEKFVTLWQQIASRFESKGERLMFESYNEMLDEKNTWTEPSSEDGFRATNALAQAFVNTIRASGGNNLHRNLIVNTYSAGGTSKTLGNFVIPTDQVPNHLMVEVHNYSPSGFTNILGIADGISLPTWTSDFEKSLAGELDILINYVNTNHVPMIIGEFGASEKIADEELGKYAEYMVTYCRQRANISLFYWPCVVDRYTFSTNYPCLTNGLLKANDY